MTVRGSRGWPGRILLGACIAAAGCGIEDESEYVESRAGAECAQLEACALGFFESEYGSAEDCLDERLDELEEANDILDDSECKFVAEEAGPCVSRIRGMSCEEWVENESAYACDLVWDCNDRNYDYTYTGYTDYSGYRSER